MIQMSQAFASGTVRAEEFNSMVESMPTLLQAAAKYIDGANGSLGAMRQKVIEGKLSSQEFFAAVEKGSADLVKQAESMEKTWDSAITGMTNSVGRLISKLTEASGAASGLKRIMADIGKVSDRLDSSIDAQIRTAERKLKFQQDSNFFGYNDEAIKHYEKVIDDLQKLKASDQNKLLHLPESKTGVNYGTQFGPDAPAKTDAKSTRSSGGGGSSKADSGERDADRFAKRERREGLLQVDPRPDLPD